MRHLRFWVAWLRWWFKVPGYDMGAPWLGDGEERERMRRIFRNRYLAAEPKREDYGL
jgi:hypothetical protein